MQELYALWENELPRLPGSAKVVEAIRHALSYRMQFERILADGRLEIDSNTVERAIRPQTMTRKNALFAGCDDVGHTWATIATLVATARLNDVDPQAWPAITLQRIANGWPNKGIDDLLPWNYSKA